MKWVAVVKSDQFVHRVVGLFDSAEQAERWTLTTEEPFHLWCICEFETVNE